MRGSLVGSGDYGRRSLSCSELGVRAFPREGKGVIWVGLFETACNTTSFYFVLGSDVFVKAR